MPTTCLALSSPTSLPQPITADLMVGVAITATLSIASFLLGGPILSMAFIASGLGMFTFAAARVEPAPSIESRDLREMFFAIELAHRDIVQAANGAPRIKHHVAPTLDRCATAVQLCRRMALLANPLHAYLSTHDVRSMRWELERLRHRAEGTTDQHATSALGHAIAARAREIETYERIFGMRDRIAARLEFCRAALASFAATIVALQFTDDEQLALAAGTVAEHCDGASDDLAILEEAFATELAA